MNIVELIKILDINGNVLNWIVFTQMMVQLLNGECKARYLFPVLRLKYIYVLIVWLEGECAVVEFDGCLLGSRG